jgi:ribosomal protein L37AE/L43A
MRDRSRHLEKQVAVAADKILGTKFCFSCQKDRTLELGKIILRGKTKTWRCHSCANKQSPVGFTKDKTT